ncbi:hypothetical protein JOE59_002773 [Agromyces cerinus]|uniref:hypothetical protein n=1 Tax=Agromyces cerinus TaxID=33878 RepID=UPI00195E58AA|nr:hypothetical protein [Agromyces cerinus]MBM7832068.1 hypothetical protein [Agromyces cerinus]
MINKRQLALLAAPTAARALVAGVFAAGHLVGRSTYDARSVSYTAGYDMARENFCNLKMNDEGYASAFDTRRAESLDENLLIADASCMDWQIEAWNSAQERQGNDLRACRPDNAEVLWAGTLITCTATVNLN